MDKKRRIRNAPLSASIEIDANGCWIWTAARNAYGYGIIRLNGKHFMTHRFMYESHNGPIPEGLDLDHLCRVRCCINPEHLEAVSRKTNLLRGTTVTARNAAVTHCPRGHEYTEANTGRTRRGSRYCKRCNVDRVSAYQREHGRLRSRKRSAA